MKKILSLALALVLVLSLSATAFAAPANATGTATIEVYIEGDLYMTLDATVTAGTTVYDAINQNAETLEPDWIDVPDYFDPTVTHKVASTIMGAGSDPVGEASGIKAKAWSTVNPGYGLMSVDQEEETAPITAYNYVYAGYDWVYLVNGKTPTGTGTIEGDEPVQLYMEECVLKDGDVITLDYDLQVEYWSSSTPWMPAYPYI